MINGHDHYKAGKKYLQGKSLAFYKDEHIIILFEAEKDRFLSSIEAFYSQNFII